MIQVDIDGFEIRRCVEAFLVCAADESFDSYTIMAAVWYMNEYFTKTEGFGGPAKNKERFDG